MTLHFNRRHFLKANKMVALALGISLSSMASEESLLRNAGVLSVSCKPDGRDEQNFV